MSAYETVTPKEGAKCIQEMIAGRLQILHISFTPIQRPSLNDDAK